MPGDQFQFEGPVTADALTAATTAPIAREAWADGYVLRYSAADGKLHPVAVPAGPAPSGAANLFYATPDGTSGAASLRALVIADIANGLITNAKLANSSATVNTSGGITGGGTLSLGGSLSLSLSAIPNAALANGSLTVSAGTGLAGGGSVALGGSTSLSLPNVGTAGTYAYPSSLTTDDQGRVSSVTAGSAPTIGGSAVMLAQVSTAGGAGWIFAGDYFGLSQMIESGRGTTTNVAPWVAPCAGTLKNFRTWTVAAAPSNSAFTVYQAASSSTPTYNATAAVLNIASGAHLGADTTHTLTIAAGDLIIFKTDTSWTNPGFCIQAQFIPSTS